MKTLNLYKLWQVMNKLSNKMEELSEKYIYVSLLGVKSEYYTYTFEYFLDYYSFKIQDGTIIVYNDDNIAWEDDTNSDFSYVPIELLEMSDEEFDIWMEKEIESLLAEQEEEKIARKEIIKSEIERLQKQLENL